MAKVATKLALDYLVKLGYVTPAGAKDNEFVYELTVKSMTYMTSTVLIYVVLSDLITVGTPPNIGDFLRQFFMSGAIGEFQLMKNAAITESEYIQLSNEVNALVDGMKNINELVQKIREVLGDKVVQIQQLISNWSFI